MSFETPILFLIFNRPETTAMVFEQIKKIKPKYLYIAADGPRDHKEGEAILCMQTRTLVIEKIDWDCEVKTLFREKNLGCGIAVSSAITWFFENVDQGIILEDDCLPSQSFFEYCEYLLNKYKNDVNVGMISGFSVIKSKQDFYFYNPLASIWGWASWQRAWKGYNLDVFEIDINKFNKFKNKMIRESFIKTLENQHKQLTTWDIQWEYHILKNNYKKISPSKNLIQNIGYTGTHTNKDISNVQKLKSQYINYKLMFLSTSEKYINEYENFIIENIKKDLYGTNLDRFINIFKSIVKKIVNSIGYDK